MQPERSDARRYWLYNVLTWHGDYIDPNEACAIAEVYVEYETNGPNENQSHGPTPKRNLLGNLVRVVPLPVHSDSNLVDEVEKLTPAESSVGHAGSDFLDEFQNQSLSGDGIVAHNATTVSGLDTETAGADPGADNSAASGEG